MMTSPGEGFSEFKIPKDESQNWTPVQLVRLEPENADVYDPLRRTEQNEQFRHKILDPYFCFNSRNDRGKVIMKCIVRIGSDGEMCGRLLAVPQGVYSNLYKHMKIVHPTISLSDGKNQQQPSRGALICPTQSSPTRSHSPILFGSHFMASSSSSLANEGHFIKNVNTSATTSASVKQQIFRHKILDPHFCFDSENERGKAIMKCIVRIGVSGKICGRLLAVPKGIYSNLFKHMKNAHPSISMPIRPNQQQPNRGALISHAQAKHPPISSEFVSYSITSSDPGFGNDRQFVKPVHISVQNPLNVASSSSIRRPQQVFRHKILDPHFCFDSENERGRVIMRCIVQIDSCGSTCGRLLAVPRGIYSNLFKHMKNVHPDIPMLIRPNQHKFGKETLILSTETEMSFPTPMSIPEPASEQISSKSCFSTSDSTSAKQLQFDRSVLDMCAIDGIGFKFVERPGFLNMIEKLNPEITVKSKQDYTRMLKEVVESEIEPALNDEFLGLDKLDCHFSAQIWRFPGWNDVVLEVKCHYIDEKWRKIQKAIKYSLIDEELCGDALKQKFEEALAFAGFHFGEVGVTLRDCPHERKTAFNMNKIFDDSYTFHMDHDLLATYGEVEDDEYEYEIPELHPSEDRDRDLSGEYFGFGELTCVAHTFQLVINLSINCDEESKKFLDCMNQVMIFFKKLPIWTEELKKLIQFDHKGFTTESKKSRFDSLMNILEAFQKPGFGEAVNKVLQLARQDLASSDRTNESNGYDSDTNQIPELPLKLVQSTAEELFSILSPFQDAIHKLQSEVTTTSNLVILAIVSAFKKLLSIQTEVFSGLKSFLLAKTKGKLQKVLNSDEFVIAAILDPRQKLQPFTMSWDCTAETLQIPTRLDAISKLKTSYENRQSATESGVVFQTTTNQQMKRENMNSSMFDILNEASDNRITEIDIYLNEPTCASDVDPLEYWQVNSSRFPVLGLLAKRYLAIPASAGGTDRIISMCSTITNARAAKLTPEEMECAFLMKEIREPELISELKNSKPKVQENHMEVNVQVCPSEVQAAKKITVKLPIKSVPVSMKRKR